MKLPLLLPLLAITAARDLNRERREVGIPQFSAFSLFTPISAAGNSPLWQRGSCSDLSLPRFPQPGRLHRGLRGEGAREEAKQQLRCTLLQAGPCLQASPLLPRTSTCLPRPSSNLPCDALLSGTCTRTRLPCSCTILQWACSCGCPPCTQARNPRSPCPRS